MLAWDMATVAWDFSRSNSVFSSSPTTNMKSSTPICAMIPSSGVTVGVRVTVGVCVCVGTRVGVRVGVKKSDGT